MLDFAESLKDGRLFMQAHRLVNSGGLVALILEGRGSDLSGSQMRREALQGAIVSLTLVFGLPVSGYSGKRRISAEAIWFRATQPRDRRSSERRRAAPVESSWAGLTWP
jgi:ERCC4-type nuclease